MLYTFQANVFNKRLGSSSGITTSITIVANNEEDAHKEAKKSFDKYIHALYLKHNIDGNGKVRKIINIFDYDNLKLV